jgi:hypothetical protein
MYLPSGPFPSGFSTTIHHASLKNGHYTAKKKPFRTREKREYSDIYHVHGSESAGFNAIRTVRRSAHSMTSYTFNILG